MSVCLLMIKKKRGGGGGGGLLPQCMLQSDKQFHFILRVCPYTEWVFLGGSFCRADKETQNEMSKC